MTHTHIMGVSIASYNSVDWTFSISSGVPLCIYWRISNLRTDSCDQVGVRPQKAKKQIQSCLGVKTLMQCVAFIE